MEQQGQNQPRQLQPEIVQQYNKLKVEYSELFRTSLDLDEEKKEHTLVIEAIKGLNDDRKCWRLVGGVLVEKKLGEVAQSLKENIEFLDQTHTNYQNTLKQKEKDLIDFEIKNNLRPSRETIKKEDLKDEKKNTGVLA